MRQFKETFPTGGIPPRNIPRKKSTRFLEIRELLREGKTSAEIADLLGITRSSVNEYKRAYGLRSKPR